MNEEEAKKTLKTMKENIDKKYLKSRNSVAIETVLNLLEKKDRKLEEIQKEVREHIGFENRLKRDNREPDLFNQGIFYVANNINNVLKGKLNEI